MATNFYFSQKVRSEQQLYEDLVIESLRMYGQDVYYIPRDIVNEDRILADDVPSRFNSSHRIEMYIENIEGFGGEGDLFTKFGVEIRDQATFVVSRKRWTQLVARYDNEIQGVRPFEGDLIYLPLSNKLFQVMMVEHEEPFYQLSNIAVFKLRCELFEYNDENFDTGVEVIDDIEKDYAYTYLLNLDSAGDGFDVGTMVYQDLADSVTMSGEIVKWNTNTNTLSLIHIGANDGKYHEFAPDGVIYQYNSRSQKVNEVLISSIAEDNKISEIEQNTDFETFTDGFLDFSESNPFGDPS
jgi:hypothetical protein